MRRYLDTSLLVALITQETNSARLQPWFENHEPGVLHVSDWIVAEFSAALSVKVRVGNFTAEEQQQALAIFSRLSKSAFVCLPVNKTHFVHAALLADQHSLGLHAGDALHLAIAADHGAEIYTLDKRMATAGPQCGVKTFLL